MKTNILEAGLSIIKGEFAAVPPECQVLSRDNILPEFRHARFSLPTPKGRKLFGLAIEDLEDIIIISMHYTLG